MMGGGSFLRNDILQIKLLSDIFYNSYFHFTNDSNSRNNNSEGFENSQMDMEGCV